MSQLFAEQESILHSRTEPKSMPRVDEQRERPLILVVDDDEDIVSGLCELLEPQYEAVPAMDGEQAVALAKERLPDLVLMDIMMPKLNGLGAFEALRRDVTTSEIPVLFLSAKNDVHTTATCLDRGGSDYLPKPVDIRELVARIERALRESRERKNLKSLAQTDALTGLANFRALVPHLDRELKRAVRYRFDVGVLMIDMDGMKEINDRFGHEAGNHAIATFAKHLLANLRETDFAARFGGDEFVVVLPHDSPAAAAAVAERIRLGIPPLILPDGASSSVDAHLFTVSTGVASFSQGMSHCCPDKLLRAADAALYEAKRQGGNRVVIYGDSSQLA